MNEISQGDPDLVSTDSTANEANSNNNEGLCETLDEIDDKHYFLSSIIPKQILRNGYFIDSKSSTQKLLWEPARDSSCGLAFSEMLFRTLSKFFPLSLFQFEPNNGKTLENIQFSMDNDIESQHQSPYIENEVNDDGIYKPQGKTPSNKFECYSLRTLSRFDRDGIQVENNDETQHVIDINFDWIRPQDVQSSVSLVANNDCTYEFTRGKIEKEGNSFTYCLEVHIEGAKFYNHPNTIEEERLVRNIEMLFVKLRSLNDRMIMHNFELKLGAIIDEITTLKTSNIDQKCSHNEGSKGKIYFLLYQEFLDLTSKIAKLELEAYSLYSTILKKWEIVMKIRETQGFQSTPHSLVKFSSELKVTNNSFHEKVQNFRHIFKWFAKVVKIKSESLESISTVQNLHSALETLSIVQSTRKSRMDINLNTIDNSHTTMLSQNVIESKRRDKIRSELYFAKLLINHQVVERTRAVQLEWPSLKVNFNSISKIILDSYPDNVAIEIYLRRLGLADKLISTTYVTIPGEKSDFRTLSLEFLSPSSRWYQFSENPQKNTHNHQNCVNGSIFIKTQWESTQNVNNAHSHNDVGAVKKPQLTYTLIRQPLNQVRKEIANTRELCDEFLPNMKPSIRAALNIQSMRFTLTGTNHSFFNSSLLKEPLRHQLIKQRNRQQFSTTDETQIPLEESCIDTEAKQFSSDMRLRSLEEHELIENASQERDTVDPKNLKYFVKRLRKMRKVLERPKKLSERGIEDIVHDASLIKNQAASIDITWLLDKVYPPRKRSLFPNLINSRDKDVGTGLVAQQKPRLIITLISANNVLLRQEQFSMKNSSFLMSPPSIKRLSSELPYLSSPKPESSFLYKRGDLESITSKNKYTNSFVRIRFKDKVLYSRIESGDCPLWDQVLEIPLFSESMQSMTPLKLKEVEDVIEISLFDKVQLDFGKGGGYYDDEITITEENRFMGYVKVPFKELHTGAKAHGHYILHTPEVLLGYDRANNDSNLNQMLLHPNNNDGSDPEAQQQQVELKQDSKSFTSLHLSISVEPKFGHASKLSYMDHFPSNERPSIVRHAREWMNHYKNFNNSCKERHFDTLVPGINGKTWLLHRFLCSQAPPQSCRSSMYQCAHFVSLIPLLETWTSFKSLKQLQDVWFPTQTCLDILAGNWSEHAVLLANYFRFLSEEQSDSNKMDVYLAIGSSTINHKAVYVITKSQTNGTTTLWNPINGKAYACNDEKCPQINIGILVSSKNIYANIQTATHPSLLTFDVEGMNRSSRLSSSPSSSGWKPFYDQSMRPNIVSSFNLVQSPDLKYTNPNELKARELEVELLDQVKTSIRGWRRQPCSFNSDIGNRLRQFLDELEENKRNDKSQKSHEHYLASLNGICRGKYIFGLPLQFGFSDTKEVLEGVEMTGIHESKHPEVEFAAAVKVFPYECGVFSVWVFLCALSPNHYI